MIPQAIQNYLETGPLHLKIKRTRDVWTASIVEETSASTTTTHAFGVGTVLSDAIREVETDIARISKA